MPTEPGIFAIPPVLATTGASAAAGDGGTHGLGASKHWPQSGQYATVPGEPSGTSTGVPHDGHEPSGNGSAGGGSGSRSRGSGGEYGVTSVPSLMSPPQLEHHGGIRSF